MPTITANNITLYYEDNGPADAPVILLVMGLGAQMIAWPDEMVRALVAKGFRVIRFDNRDVGMSQRMEGAAAPNLIWSMLKARLGFNVGVSYTLSDMAADGIGLLDALGIEKAHVVGASMGGMIVQLMAANHRERLLTMTSIMSSSGAPGLPGARPDIQRRFMVKRPAEASREEAVAFGAELVRSFPTQTQHARTARMPKWQAKRLIADITPLGQKGSCWQSSLMAAGSNGSKPSLRPHW